ncbi:MAG: hypothetical protein FJW40_25380 [Acidobacteria bacterium]|nr:hypothetical protein [Acidobacteriota bacterium]
MNRRHFVQLPAAGLMAAGNSAGAIDVGSRKQLFIDRRFIAGWRGIRLAVQPPRKAGVVLRGERPWEKGAFGYHSVADDGGTYKMWYNSTASKGRSFHAYVTSRDGVEWTRPSLGVIEFEGSKDNNLVLQGSMEGAVYLDPAGSPRQRFKALAAAGGNRKSILGTHSRGTLVLITSPDGIHWEQEYSVLPFMPDTQNNLFWDRRINKYVAYLRSWNPQRSVARCEISKEDLFKEWPYTASAKPNYLWRRFPWGAAWPPALSTELPTVLATDERDDPNSDVYTPNVVEYPYADDVYLAFPSMFRHTAPPGSEKVPMAGPLDVHLAVSRDGIAWDRLDRSPYLGLGLDGEVDSQMLYLGLGMLRRGNDLYQYYAGYRSEHNTLPPKESALLLAVQRLDGFVAAVASYDGGELVTPPLRFQGGRLQLNIDTSAMGDAQVEMQSAVGVPLAGYELRNCRRIVSNSVAFTVSWTNGPELTRLQETPVCMRIRMRGARLFGFQFV